MLERINPQCYVQVQGRRDKKNNGSAGLWIKDVFFCETMTNLSIWCQWNVIVDKEWGSGFPALNDRTPVNVKLWQSKLQGIASYKDAIFMYFFTVFMYSDPKFFL